MPSLARFVANMLVLRNVVGISDHLDAFDSARGAHAGFQSLVRDRTLVKT